MTDSYKLRIFEYTEKHFPDQYLKIKITLDQENYNFWKKILNDKNIKEHFKEYETKYEGKLMLDIFADPLPEKIEDLEDEKIIPMLIFVHAEHVINMEFSIQDLLGDYEENSDFFYIKENSTGDPPEDIGFREITNGYTSKIEWKDDVISDNSNSKRGISTL